MNVLDLFSGIGGFSIGLERAGMRTVAFCEIEPYCRTVLRRHWPNVPIYDDVKNLSSQHLIADGIGVDVITGGFPCQDISLAGKGAGIAGERSGLWTEYARLIGELRPRYVIVENVAALLVRGLDRVLGDLAALGYDAEWHCIPASAIGAPHRRDRIWIVAYAGEVGRRAWTGLCASEPSGERRRRSGYIRGAVEVANPDSGGRREQGHVGKATCDTHTGQSRDGGEVRISSRPRLAIGPRALREWSHAATTGTGWWAIEPDVGRVVDGPADRVDRRKRLITLGNSLVPDIPEIIGRAIMETT